jgi:DNA-directed RNA polymerase subunit RPC12/RpoP
VSEYVNLRRVGYDCADGGTASFVPVCAKCGRFVKADKSIFTNEITGLSDKPNATCKRCGRTHMLFEGFI